MIQRPGLLCVEQEILVHELSIHPDRVKWNAINVERNRFIRNRDCFVACGAAGVAKSAPRNDSYSPEGPVSASAPLLSLRALFAKQSLPERSLRSNPFL